MALQSEYFISIAGQEIPVIQEFNLTEKMGEHSAFSLTVRADILESSLDSTLLLDDSRTFLGEAISIQIRAINGLEGYQELEFKGIVTGVEMIKGFHQNSGDIVLLEGSSSSIILEDGADYRSFRDMAVSDVVMAVFGNYDQSKLTTVVAPEDDSTLLYSVMNAESRFQYLKRLSMSRGEFFFYNRDSLYFGKPDMGEEITLTYGTDLMSFRLGIQPKSGSYNYIANEYHSDETVNAITNNISSAAKGYTEFASGIATNLFPNETTILHHSYDDKDNKARLDKLVDLQKKALEQQQVTINGTTDNPGVNLGKVIKIQSEKGSIGSYRVTEVKHSAKTNGNYLSHFKAVPMEIDVSPITNIEVFSLSQPQLATIVDTNDPDGLSRVQIRYAFDEKMAVNSPWIRVSSPYSGTDYGLHAIPEIGSSVIVGYHSGNIEQPYVASALYTGVQKHADWQSEENNYKGWHTKAGNKIELNDTKDGETITITDKNSNLFQIDTANNTVRITATENIEIAAKNVSITAQENITIGAEENVEIAAQKDLNALADGNLALQSSGDMTAKSNASLAMEATSDISAKGMNAIIEGKTSAEVNGAQTKITGKAVTEVSAGIVKIN